MESSSGQAKQLYLGLRFVLALPAWVVVAVYLVRVAKLATGCAKHTSSAM
jgi:hypothetical protein